MTNLVLSNIISVRTVTLTNQYVVTNADGSISIIYATQMRTIALGPWLIPLLLFAAALLIFLAWNTLRRPNSSDETVATNPSDQTIP